jgi:hypothetical protein
MTLCAVVTIGSPVTAEGGIVPRVESYPQVYDLSETKQANLYISTSFRTRHTRFFNELSDSIGSLRGAIADTERVSAIFSLWINDSGKMDSVRVACSDSSKSRIVKVVHDRLQTWHFATSPSGKYRILQDFVSGPTHVEGFLRKNRKKVFYGSLIVLGILFFMW